MARSRSECPSCSAPLGYRTVDIGLFPPRVSCPGCQTSLSGINLLRLPSNLFLTVSIALGLVVGISIGALVTVLSNDLDFKYRFMLVAIAAVAVVVITLVRTSFFRRREDSD